MEISPIRMGPNFFLKLNPKTLAPPLFQDRRLPKLRPLSPCAELGHPSSSACAPRLRAERRPCPELTRRREQRLRAKLYSIHPHSGSV